jgi:hypothetical protein
MPMNKRLPKVKVEDGEGSEQVLRGHPKRPSTAADLSPQILRAFRHCLSLPLTAKKVFGDKPTPDQAIEMSKLALSAAKELIKYAMPPLKAVSGVDDESELRELLESDPAQLKKELRKVSKHLDMPKELLADAAQTIADNAQTPPAK